MPKKIRLIFGLVLCSVVLVPLSFVAFAQVIPYNNLLFIPVVIKPDTATVPTATTSPQPTQIPTPIPTATTLAPADVEILQNYSTYTDIIDTVHLVGEIKNNTQSNLSFVKVTANFYDSSNQIVGTSYTYVDPLNLPAGEKTCFEIYIDTDAPWTSFRFEAPTYWDDGAPKPNLTLVSVNSSYNSLMDWYEIVGEVRNDHGSRVEYVSPVATLYGPSGYVVGCDYTYVSSTHLDPGQTSSFKITVTDNVSNINTFRILLGGTPK